MGNCCSVFPTAFGWCGLIAGEKELKRLILPLQSEKRVISQLASLPHEKNNLLKEAQEMIRDYFEGKKVPFDLPLDCSGFSPFQTKVYGLTRMIPYGKVKTYGEIAREIETPNASRAVGSALGRNPLPLFIPCHRVIRKDRSLGGFSCPDGVFMKERLLKLEGAF